MKQQKDISIDGHNFMLLYNDEETNVSDINSLNCSNLIWVEYTPPLKEYISEEQGDIIFDKYESYLIEEIRKVINENQSFYDNFVVNYDFFSNDSSLDNHLGRTPLIKKDRHLNIRLKENM